MVTVAGDARLPRTCGDRSGKDPRRTQAKDYPHDSRHIQTTPTKVSPRTQGNDVGARHAAVEVAYLPQPDGPADVVLSDSRRTGLRPATYCYISRW